MSARSFVDTNVLVYTDDADTPDKQQVALDLAAAKRSGCTVVYTENLASGASLAGVEIRNPFV